MTTRQNDKFAFPSWFKNVVWLLSVLGALVLYHVTTYSSMIARVSVLETELKNLKESYRDDVIEILKKTDEIIKKLPDK